MRNTATWRLLVTVLTLTGFSIASHASPKKTQAKAYRDINAIGHRVFGFQSGLGNWYSLEREKQIGAQLSAEYEKSAPLIHDDAMQAYLDCLVQTISQNSDTKFQIAIRLVDSEDSFALTLAGGYQYVSRGLLLQMENEGELAAVIARGIAHTSLRSATGLATRATLVKAMDIPLIQLGSDGSFSSRTSDRDVAIPLTYLKYSRDDEFAADYFGIQYLYKSGYSPECFVSFIQKVWPPKFRRCGLLTRSPQVKRLAPFLPCQSGWERYAAKSTKSYPSRPMSSQIRKTS
jgi:predicted Zn-dependent protease